MPTQTNHTDSGEGPFHDAAGLCRDELRVSALVQRRLSAALARVPAESGGALARHLPGWLDGYEVGTARTYLFRVLTWLEFCAYSEPPVDPLAPQLAAFQHFHGRFLPHAPVHPDGSPRSARTRAGIQSACVELLRYVHAADVAGVRNRFAEAKAPRVSRQHTRLRPHLTTMQIRQLADAAATDHAVTSGPVPGQFGAEQTEGDTRPWSPLGPVVIGLMSWLGMRGDVDVLARNVDDLVDTRGPDGSAVLLLCGPSKGGPPRRWEVPAGLAHTMAAWLRYREQIVATFGADFAEDARGDALLVSPRSGRRLGERQVRRLVHRCGTRIGLDALTPRDLRAAFAYLARRLGVDERDLQEALGHANVETTRLYSAEVDRPGTRPAEAIAAGLAPHWPAPDDPAVPAGGVSPNTCGCGGLPWSVLTASLEPWGHPDQAVLVEPATEWSPSSAQQLTARCKCGVVYPPGRPVSVTGFVADGATDEFRRILLRQGAETDAV